MFKTFFSKQRAFMILGLALSFILVKGLSQSVFTANSPTVNPHFIAGIVNFPQTLAQRFTSKATIDIKDKTDLIPVSKGVYAREQGGVRYTNFNLDQIEWTTMSITTKTGKIKTITFPKDNPPIKELIDAIQSEKIDY